MNAATHRRNARIHDKMARDLAAGDNPPAQVQDKIRELRARAADERRQARELEQREAAPADTGGGDVVQLHPKRSRSSKVRRHARGAGRAAGRAARGAAPTPQLRRGFRTGYRRSGAQKTVRSAGSIGWQVAGVTIGLALLTLFLTKQGVGAFSGIANTAVGALRLVIDPIDPLAVGAVANTLNAAAPATTTAAGIVISPVLGAIPSAGGELRPPANRRAPRVAVR